MIALLENKRDEIAALCRQYRIKRLDIFGSAATGRSIRKPAISISSSISAAMSRGYPIGFLILRTHWKIFSGTMLILSQRIR